MNTPAPARNPSNIESRKLPEISTFEDSVSLTRNMADFPLTVNMTPHDICVYDNEEKTVIITFPASGYVCRCTSETPESQLPDRGGIPMIEAPRFRDVEGLPPSVSAPDVLVSMPVGEFLRDHPDWYRGAVLGPDTGPGYAVRDDGGAIRGTTRLVLYKYRE